MSEADATDNLFIMLPQKHFYSLLRRQVWFRLSSCRQDCGDCISGVNSLLHNVFCTAANPCRVNDSGIVDESPELPGWVKSLDKDRGKETEDDDFVPPSISYWIENPRVHVEDVDMKSVVKDIPESDIDKVSKILRHWFESPDLFMKALNKCDVDMSDSLVDQVLRRFSCEWRPGFEFFKWSELHKGMRHSPELYNLLIDNLGKTRKFHMIWKLVEEMKGLQGYATLDTMTKIIRRLAKAGKHEDAIGTFRTLESFGVDRDITGLNNLMDVLVKEGGVEHAERVFLEFKDIIPPTSHTYNILVHGWCKIRQIDKAKRTMNEMKQHGFQPEVITYTCFIEAYCRERDFRKVDAILEEMQKNGCPPSIVTYTIILNALARAKEMNKAMKVYEKMKESNCSPDAAFYNVFIKALSTSGRLKDADAVFEDILKQGIVLDVSIYNTLICIAAQNSQEEKALKLLMKMEESGCRPDLNTYVPLLKMCCILNRMKVLSFLLDHMFKNDISLDLGTYSLLISRLCKNGNLERACFYFKELILKGFVPMDCMYENLIKALEKKGMSREIQEIEELISSNNFKRMEPGKRGSKLKK